MLQAIETAQRAKAAMMELGQPEEIITKNSMEISVRKAKFSDFLNSTASRRQFMMSFDNSSEISEMQLWVCINISFFTFISFHVSFTFQYLPEIYVCFNYGDFFNCHF